MMLNLNNVYLIAKMTLVEAIRGKIVRVLLIISSFLVCANLVVTKLYSWGLGKVTVEFGISVLALTGLLIIFFLGLKLLYNDLERHNIYFLFSRPISVSDYVFGKFCGLAVIIVMATVMIGIGTSISVQYVLYYFPNYISPNFSWLTFLYALFFQCVSLLVVLAISIFWFSYITEAFVALILSLCTYQIGQSMELVRRLFIESYQETTIDHMTSLLSKVLSYLFPNLSFFDLKAHAAYGLPISGSALLFKLVYGVSYIVILLVLSSYFFSKKKNL